MGLGAAVSFGFGSPPLYGRPAGEAGNTASFGRIENEIVLHGRRNNQAWFAPAAGVIPGNADTHPQVFVTVVLLTGDDVGPHFYLKTDDLGKTWSNPILCQNWFKQPLDDNVFEKPLFGLHYHRRSNTLVAIGRTLFVRDQTQRLQKNEHPYSSPQHEGSTVYSLWDPRRGDFQPWKRMRLPDGVSLQIFFHGQFHEDDDGTLLIPGAYPGLFGAGNPSTDRGLVIVRCGFDGRELQYLEHGRIIPIEAAGGWSKYSLVHFQDRYFLTIRHGDRGSVTSSRDGLHFDANRTWRFDDGGDLGNYNTGQKWLKHGGKLYLIYTRRNESSGGVFRHRAPLFIGEVDTDQLAIRKNTESIVFPAKGARMGNFHVANVSDDESWVLTGEWLQRTGHIQYIGDLLLARIIGR